ncbi:T9SS type B sorting domain-containing protein [Winogradskyella sp. SYSU M77433]|uniref:T9SS type B sorting domain-containing protein n=1 Tax=Winogradskyella sp. SYSU M77433 TaxID=3042722 RepID=UPI0024818A17|nr:T9SS type B sorting domain-containing protein [Winogradskyella sp. SYSU M77433]MDH7911188.1 T9SS type B sorting domain-containing protein [Winogradskyella sp. SYSU M77433]
MKKIYFTLLSLIICTPIFAQNEAAYWYFGQNAGLRFDADTGNVTALTDGQISTLEGCTSISDANGDLMLYTDGRTVWNRNHQIMANGNYFGGTGLLGDPSSTSSGLIVPKPDDPTKYYIFTVDEPHHQNAAVHPNQFTGFYDSGGSVPSQDDGFNNGFNYSLVDMTLNGGLGDVDPIEKNVHLVTYDTTNPEEVKFKCAEKITAVRAEDCSSFWVITHFTSSFYAFKIDANGVDPNPVISTVAPNIPISGYRRNALGYLKASPDGSKIIVAHMGEATVTAGDAAGSVHLYDFDNSTGIVSNGIELYGTANGDSPYGVEFSAENRKAYATIGLGAAGNGASQVVQWDLESSDIPSSMQIIHSSSTTSAGALQLAADRKIYRAQLSFTAADGSNRFLGIIHNPEANGTAANYDAQGILLDVTGLNQNLSQIGLPPFIQSLFNSEIDIIRNDLSTTELRLCTGDSYTLQADDIATADYFWTFDGNPLAEDSHELFVDTPGFYEVYIEPNNGDCPIIGSAVVGVYEIPVANNLANVNVCDGDIHDGISTFDFSSKNSEALLSQDPAEHNVRYFESLDDANNLENEIVFPYTNIENPQTIYVRVDNVENTNCFDVNSFQLEVYSTPQIVQLNDIEFCDNEGDAMDGIATIDLNVLIPAIAGSQENAEVSFHSSQEDADDNISSLPLSYTNTSSPFNDTIVVRIENSESTDCYSTQSFEITINDAPIANDISIIQCDEDGIPEGFTTFNILAHEEEVTNGNTNSEVKYYLSEDNAQNDINELTNPEAFDNFFTPQIIYTRVTNTTTDCVNFSEISLEISTTSINNATLELCDTDGTEDGFMNFDLSQSDAIVLAGAPVGLDLQYYETYEDALLETFPLTSSFTNSIAYNQTIYARVENANACFGISEIELRVFELPNIETENETLYCLNFFPETIVLDGGIQEDLANNYLYSWSTGENTSTIEVNETGTYTVRVTNTNGCFKDRTINVLPSNIATIENIEIVDASSNNSISVFVTGEGDYEYALDNVNGPYQDSPIFENVEPGFYTVFVRDKNNCGIAEELVSVIGFPKFFTPNNDTINDFWQVYGISNQFQQNSIIYIFDRYGKLLTQLDPLGPGWDGMYNGKKMPSNDYWFKVTLEDGRTFTSHFALKR